ncbi:MAG: thymidine phosphorylase [Anaerolineales bacterium]
MRAVDIIIKKRDKGELTKEEIEFFINGFTSGDIPSYQAAAWAMAVALNGMTPRETTDLTLTMAQSGEILDLSQVGNFVVDKHSTGGVGDKTTLVVAPMVAACCLPVGKMSGRGLGFSGGTLDKMESIPGFRTDLTRDEFIDQIRSIGLVLTGQTADLAPADGKLYSLRDVTGTVESIPLIASSIMSKKIASGTKAIVLDVKIGSGAFIKNMENARELSSLMVEIARLAGAKAVAILSDMNQPLGSAVGNALELEEAINTLHGEGPTDFLEHCLMIAGQMLTLGGVTPDAESGKKYAKKTIQDGSAWGKFRKLVIAQSGDVSYIDEPAKLPSANIIETVNSPEFGYISEINALTVGKTAVTLGAGRSRKGDSIDHAVGIVLHHKVGNWVEVGDPLFSLHAQDRGTFEIAKEKLLNAYGFSPEPVEPLPLFYGVIE